MRRRPSGNCSGRTSRCTDPGRRLEVSQVPFEAGANVEAGLNCYSWTVCPASRSPLERLYLRQRQILLVYAHGLARLWDLDSGTMQKSMDHSGVVSLLSHMDGWTEMYVPMK